MSARTCLLWLAMGIALGAPPLQAASSRISDETYYQFKLNRLKASDHQGFLALGKWAESKDRISWARQCYRKALEAGHSPSYPEAAFRLARIEISLEKYAQAMSRLRKVKAKYSHKPTEALLAETEKKLTRAQKALWEQGQSAFDRHLYLEAKDCYRKALAIIPEGYTGGGLVSEDKLLAAIIQCNITGDRVYLKQQGFDAGQESRACPDCGDTPLPGFEPCGVCKGGPERKTCKTCRGQGWSFCRTCLGAGKVLESGNKQVTAILKQVNALMGDRLTRRMLRYAERIRPILYNASPDALVLLAKLTGRRKPLEPIWDTIPSIPLPPYLNDAEAQWRAMDWRYKAAFLHEYAMLYARFLKTHDFFRHLKSGMGKQPDVTLMQAQNAPSVFHVLAFPEKHQNQFITFEATLKAARTLPTRINLTVKETDAVVMDIWRRKAERDFRHLSLTTWRKKLGRMPGDYPFRQGDDMATIPPGWRFRITGRLLRNRYQHPPYHMETWAIRPLYPAGLAAICGDMERPIQVALRNVQLSELLAVLDTLSGLDIRLSDAPLNSRLNMIAESCALGRVLARLADILELKIYRQDDAVMLASAGPQQAVQDMTAFLAYLKKNDKGLLVAGLNTQGTKKSPSPPATPGDTKVVQNPVEALKSALDGMAYRDAILHSQVLMHQTSRQEKKDLVKKYLALARLGHRMTAPIATTHFTGHDTLHRLHIRDTSGEEKSNYYVVLERSTRGLVIQAAYGTQFTLPSAQLTSEETLTIREWQKQVIDRINRRLAGLNDADPEKTASELFSAMMLAKASGLLRQGNILFKRLIKSSAFPWIANTFYPDHEKELLAQWRVLGYEPAKPDNATGTDMAEHHPGGQGRGDTETTPRGDGTSGQAAASPPGETLPDTLEGLADFAEKHLSLGKKHRRLSMPGQPDFKTHLTKAMHHLRLARLGLTTYLKQKPKDLKQRKRLTEAAILLEGCVKDSPFFN